MGTPRQPLGPEQLFEYAVQALQRASLTEHELRQRLSRRTPRQEHVEEVIQRLSGLSYLDDRQVGESFARFRLSTGGQGSARVRRDLQRRGLDEEVAAGAVQNAYEGQDERQLAQKALAKRLKAKGITSTVADPREASALAQWLQRNGFTAEIIADVLADVCDPSDWLESLLDHLSFTDT